MNFLLFMRLLFNQSDFLVIIWSGSTTLILSDVDIFIKKDAIPSDTRTLENILVYLSSLISSLWISGPRMPGGASTTSSTHSWRRRRMDSGNNSTVILFRAHSLPPIIDTLQDISSEKELTYLDFSKTIQKQFKNWILYYWVPGFNFIKS